MFQIFTNSTRNFTKIFKQEINIFMSPHCSYCDLFSRDSSGHFSGEKCPEIDIFIIFELLGTELTRNN